MEPGPTDGFGNMLVEAHAGGKNFVHVGRAPSQRDQLHGARRKRLPDERRRLQTSHIWHVQVEQDKAGTQLLVSEDSLRAVVDGQGAEPPKPEHADEGVSRITIVIGHENTTTVGQVQKRHGKQSEISSDVDHRAIKTPAGRQPDATSDAIFSSFVHRGRKR